MHLILDPGVGLILLENLSKVIQMITYTFQLNK